VPTSTVDAAVARGREFRELDIPVDYFMVSILTLGGIHTSVAETKELSEELGKMGIKTGLYVAPMLNLGTEMEKEARQRGYCLMREDGSPYEISLGAGGEQAPVSWERQHIWQLV